MASYELIIVQLMATLDWIERLKVHHDIIHDNV
jgi:hypothetical protein